MSLRLPLLATVCSFLPSGRGLGFAARLGKPVPRCFHAIRIYTIRSIPGVLATSVQRIPFAHWRCRRYFASHDAAHRPSGRRKRREVKGGPSQGGLPLYLSSMFRPCGPGKAFHAWVASGGEGINPRANPAQALAICQLQSEQCSLNMTSPTATYPAVPTLLDPASPQLVPPRHITSKPVPIARRSTADDVYEDLWPSPPLLTAGSSAMSRHMDYLATPAPVQPHNEPLYPVASSSRNGAKPLSPPPDLRSESDISFDAHSSILPRSRTPYALTSQVAPRTDFDSFRQERQQGRNLVWSHSGVDRSLPARAMESNLSAETLAGLEPTSSRSPVSVDDWRRHVTPTSGLASPCPTQRPADPTITPQPERSLDSDGRANLQVATSVFQRYQGPITELGIFQPTFHPSARQPRSEFAVTDTASSDSVSEAAGDAMSIDPSHTSLSDHPRLPGPGISHPTPQANRGLTTAYVGEDFHHRSTSFGLGAVNSRFGTGPIRDDHMYPLRSLLDRRSDETDPTRPVAFWSHGRPSTYPHPVVGVLAAAESSPSGSRLAGPTVPPPRPAVGRPPRSRSPPLADHLLLGHVPYTPLMQRSTSIGTAFRARRHAERLQQLDALRSGATQMDSSAQLALQSASTSYGVGGSEAVDQSSLELQGRLARPRTPTRDVSARSSVRRTSLGAERTHGGAPYTSSPPSRSRYHQNVRQATLARLNEPDSIASSSNSSGQSYRHHVHAPPPPLPSLSSFSWQTGDRPSTIPSFNWPRRNSILEEGLEDLDADASDLVDMGMRRYADTASGSESEDTAYLPLPAFLIPDNREMPDLAAYRAAMLSGPLHFRADVPESLAMAAVRHANLGGAALGGSALLRIVERFAFKADATAADNLEVIRTVIRFTGRWPALAKKEGAENQLKRCEWSAVDHVSDDMVKDTFCSVCHDEVRSYPLEVGRG